MIQFNFLRTKSVENIIFKIQNYNYVSFDIFDTLLRRSVPVPTDVFEIVGRKHGNNDFKVKRIEAEKIARQHSDKEEVTLNDIYDELDLEYSDYKSDELNVEADLLSADPRMYKVYKYCQDQKKHIIITSDMYLSENFLSNILNKNGIAYERCFISSEYGVQKVSGNLFRKELEELHITPSQIIHIGDSIRADGIGAWKAGIRFVLVPKASNIRSN